MQLKQKIKQWSPDEPDHALVHNNSSMDTPGLHSTLYSEFNESEQEAVRALASLSNSRNGTSFSPLLSPMLQSPGTAPLFAPCSSPLPTFSSKPPKAPRGSVMGYSKKEKLEMLRTYPPRISPKRVRQNVNEREEDGSLNKHSPAKGMHRLVLTW